MPGTKRFICAPNKNQSAQIAREKMIEIYDRWPLLKREVLGGEVSDLPGSFGKDYVSINDYEGTVVDINLRSTRIKTLDNSIITIPNEIVANSITTNYSAIDKRRIDEVIGIVYSTSNEKIDKAVQIIKDILRVNQEVETNDNLVYLEKLNSSSIDIHMQAYVKYSDVHNLRRIRENVIKEIIRQYRNEGIDFAFPSQSIYLTNEN